MLPEKQAFEGQQEPLDRLVPPPRRFRRRLWLSGTVLFLLGSFFVLYRYAQSELFQRNLQTWALPYLSQALSAEVQCRHMQIGLFTGQVIAEGLTISKIGKKDLPLLEIEKVKVRFQWGLPWGTSRFVLGSVILEKPVLRLHLLGQGNDNIPRSTRSSGKPQLVETIFRAAFRVVEVRDGLMELKESRIPVEMALQDLQLDLQWGEARRYLGNLRFRNSRMQIHRWHGEALDLDSKIEFLPQGVRFHEGLIRDGPSEVRFSGMLENLYSPNIDLAFEAKGTVEHIQDSLQTGPLFSGTVQASGRLQWQDGFFQTRGRFFSPELHFQGLTAGQVQGDFTLSKDGLTLNAIQTTLLGGRAEGLFSYDWRRAGTVGHGEFNTQGLSVQQAWHDLLKIDWPNHSRIYGKIQFGWEGNPGDWQLEAQSTLTPPKSIPPERSSSAEGTAIPLLLDPSGDIDLRLYKGIVQINRLALSFPQGSLVKASGNIGMRAPSALSVIYLSPNLKESLQLMDHLSGNKNPLTDRIWLPTTIEEIGFQGEVTGMVTNPVVGGTITVTRPAWRYSGWDSFRAELHRTPEKIILDPMLLSGEGGQIRAAAEIPTVGEQSAVSWQLKGDSPDLRLDFLSRPLLPDSPLSGRAEAQFELYALGPTLRGKAHASLQTVSALGFSPGDLETTIRLDDDRIEWEMHSPAEQQPLLSASGSYRINTGQYTIVAESKALPLADIPFLTVSKDRLDGKVDVTIRGQGDIRQPQLQGEASSTSLSVMSKIMEGVQSRFRWSGQEVQWSGKGHMAAGDLNWDVSIRWDSGPPHWTAKVEIDRYDLLQWAQDSSSGLNSTLHSQASGNINISGPFLQPVHWTMEAIFPKFDLTVGSMDFHARGPLRGKFSSGRLEIEKSVFETLGGELILSGTVDPNSNAPLNLRVSSQLDLKPFESFLGGLNVSGKSFLEVVVQGSTQAPRLRGTCRLENVNLGFPGLDYTIENLGGEIFFDGNALRASNLRGSFAGGSLSAGGSAQLEGASLSSFLLNIRLGKVQLRIPQGFRTLSNADLAWRGNLTRHYLTGDIRVEEAEYNRKTDFFRDFGTLLPSAKANAPKQRFLDQLSLDLQIRFDSGMEIRTDTLRLSADGNLRLLGPTSNLSLLGRISAASGELVFLGNTYEITQGGVEFVNPLQIEPLFDLSAVTNVHGYRITLQLTGRPDSIKPDMRSEPPLPMLDLLTLLSTGVTSNELLGRATEGGNVGMAASSLLVQGLSQQVESRMQRLLGFRQFRIDPYLSSRSNNPTARVTLERRVAKNLSLTYSTDLTSAEQQIVLIEYFFDPDYSLIASRDEKGNYGLDLRIQRRF